MQHSLLSVVFELSAVHGGGRLQLPPSCRCFAASSRHCSRMGVGHTMSVAPQSAVTSAKPRARAQLLHSKLPASGRRTWALQLQGIGVCCVTAEMSSISAVLPLYR